MSANPHQRPLSNRGGGYVEDLEVVPEPPDGHYLRFRGPVGIVSQIRLTDPRYQVTTATERGQQILGGPGIAPPQKITSLLDLLSHHVLTVKCPEHVDFALALDWYKTPIDEQNPKDWPNTAVGELVHRGKYWYSKKPSEAAKQRECGLALVDRLQSVISNHPLLRGIGCVAAVPGHDAQVVSFGARLAASVAQTLKTQLVPCSALAEFRTPAKNLGLTERVAVITNQFVCHYDLTGWSMLIIDDIFSSGSTVAETARALRAAGATRVASLCAVRTMRS
jgi:hypothetical protein